VKAIGVHYAQLSSYALSAYYLIVIRIFKEDVTADNSGDYFTGMSDKFSGVTKTRHTSVPRFQNPFDPHSTGLHIFEDINSSCI
jgi:hypothetical protein